MFHHDLIIQVLNNLVYHLLLHLFHHDAMHEAHVQKKWQNHLIQSIDVIVQKVFDHCLMILYEEKMTSLCDGGMIRHVHPHQAFSTPLMTHHP